MHGVQVVLVFTQLHSEAKTHVVSYFNSFTQQATHLLVVGLFTKFQVQASVVQVSSPAGLVIIWLEHTSQVSHFGMSFAQQLATQRQKSSLSGIWIFLPVPQAQFALTFGVAVRFAST